MPLKGTISVDHFPKNLFSLRIPGLSGPDLTIISVGSLEVELETVNLPDRVVVSGGNTRSGETDVVTPGHHLSEQDVWEKWWRDSSIQPVAVDYIKTAVLTESSNSGIALRSWIIDGCFPKKRSLSEKDMENEGEDSRVTWTLAFSNVIPV